MLGQRKINENISRKFVSTDKVLESIDSRLEDFGTTLHNQLSHNKMLETQIVQLVASIVKLNARKLQGQPEVSPIENVSFVTTRGGKATQDPPHPKGVEVTKEPVLEDDKVVEEGVENVSAAIPCTPKKANDG